MSKNKKIIDERLREAALMFKSGLPTNLVADLTGVPEKSVEHLCWIYKWPPEKLDEMTARAKRSGQVGASARAYLKKFFIMHPEQRPAPHLQLFRADPKEPVESYVRDRNAHERLDRLWSFASDQNERLIKAEQYLSTLGVELNDRIGTIRRAFDEQNERLIKVEQRFGVLDEIDAGLDERINTVSEIGPELREAKISGLEEHIKAIEIQVNYLTKKYDEIATEQFRPVTKINHRLDAITRQIEHLQRVLKDVYRVLPAEYE